MKLAPLQLESYFLTDLNCQANPQFKANKETKFQEKDLEVGAGVNRIKERTGRWQVSLNIKLQPAPETNSPYSFSLSLVGVICWVGPELPEDKLEVVVRTNGLSMLYGVAREMARDLTARGPFPALVLPSVSFIPDAAAAPAAKAPEASKQLQAAPEAVTGAGGKRTEGMPGQS
jgi:preprotein translocase subunit SecB